MMTRTSNVLRQEAIAAAEQLGFHVRFDWLEGCGGGISTAAGEKWIFVDRGLRDSEQIRQIIEAVKDEPGLRRLALSGPLRCCVETWAENKAA